MFKSYLAWRRRIEERAKAARGVDELPGCFGSFTRWLLPHGPGLRDGEELLFDFMAQRIPTGALAYFIPFRNQSYGRLTVTSERLIFRTGWMARILFLFKPPSSVGSLDVSLAAVHGIETLPWINRAVWGASVLPGVTMAEITLADGEKVRFGGMMTAQWQRSIETLRQLYPHLDSLGPPS
jgi:hypothetical protein